MSQSLVDKKSMRVRVFFVYLILASGSAFAGERYEFYNGIRGLGMGGAQVATVNDETAMVINPAALGKLRDYFITIADPELSFGESTEQIAGTDVLNMLKPQNALDKSLTNPDKHLHLRGQVFPSIVIPNFGFGVFDKYEVNSELVSSTNEFMYHYTHDVAAVMAANLRIWHGIIKVGANGRFINRVEVREDTLDATRTDLTLNSLAKEGRGIASDAGIMIAAPIAWLPTLSAVYRDIGDTKYTLSDSNGYFTESTTRPTTTKSSLDVGLAVFPIFGKRIRSTFTAEYRDVLTDDELESKAPQRRIHAGAELNVADAFFIRAGMNQRYWTAGLELAIMNYQFQAAAYGEDIGTTDTPREDRRYTIKFAFRF